MPYISQADIEARYPGELAQAGPRDADNNLDAAAIARACEEASAKADGYIQVAGTSTPLALPAPSWLNDIAVDIALYKATPTVLASQTDFADRRKRYLDAIALLESIADGSFVPEGIGGSSGSVNSAGVVAITSAPRLFYRGVL